jgi:2-phosphosulfolactate phosphatase
VPRIIRKSLLEGAGAAEGIAVIIDVFRAFSCAPLFFHFGASRVILEADAETAVSMKKSDPDLILVGEVNEIPIEGGDLTNSPVQIIERGGSFFAGKTVVHRTTAGVAGVKAAWENGADVILGSFVMARSIARYLAGTAADRVAIVAMGSRGTRKAPEDEACADYIEHLLTGKAYDHIAALKSIIFQETSRKFTAGTKTYLPPEDPIFCLQRDLFPFVLGVKEKGGLLEVHRLKGYSAAGP